MCVDLYLFAAVIECLVAIIYITSIIKLAGDC